MKVVIDIPESIFDTIQADEMISCEQLAVLQMHIQNGIPLPKGHGRLVDLDELMDRVGLEDNEEYRENNIAEFLTMEDVDRTPIIIEADKEAENERTD